MPNAIDVEPCQHASGLLRHRTSSSCCAPEAKAACCGPAHRPGACSCGATPIEKS